MAKLNDLIRCEDAIKEICKRTCTPGVLCPDAYCKEVKEWITDDMVVDAVPVRRGRWIRVYSRPGVFKYLGWTCDQCGQRTGNEYAPQWYKFCPNCGARMDGKDGDHAEGTIQKERS